MAKLEELNVTVTYRVGLKNIDVSEFVLNGLNKICDEMYGDINYNKAQLIRDKEIQEAYDWLESNIQEVDAWDWEHEIDLG